MSLRLTRAVNDKFYGGFDLDVEDLDGTFDHCVWVRRVINNYKDKRVVLNLITKDGTQELALDVGETHDIEKNIGFKLTGIQEHWAEQEPPCDICGKGGDTQARRMIPQAKFGIDAPDNYRILRHDIARKK